MHKPELRVPSTSVSVPFNKRRWIDIETERFQTECKSISKMMTRLLRHDNHVNRENDGAVRFDILLVKMKAKYANISDWNCKAWITWLATGGGSKKRVQYCVNPQSPGQSYISELFKSTQERILLIPH